MTHEKTILIIEDDETIRETLKEILEQEGYHILTASNGLDGLKILKQNNQLCLILLDLFMPIMSGLEFLKALQVEKPMAIASLPILVLSASPPEGEAALQVKPITQGFIKKPVDLEGFLSAIAKYCY